MREILFRGKNKYNNEWVYGQLIVGNNYNFIITKEDYDDVVASMQTLVCQCHPVEKTPNTIGQYTGLTDKNGKKIFEGDIVRLTDLFAHYDWTAVVEFGNPNGEYVWGWNLKPTPRCCNSRLSEFNKDILCWVEMPVGATCEIIGNIWDNPELLEGESE